MNTLRSLIKPFGKKYLLVITALFLLFTVSLSRIAVSAADNADKEKVVRQVAQKWIQIGSEQYDRGLYKAAEQSLQRAKDYQEYLSTAEADKLNKLLEKAHTASVQRDKILQHIQTADRLVKQSKLTEAKASLQEISGSEFLTKDEQKVIGERLQSIDNQLREMPAARVQAPKADPKAPVAAISDLKTDEASTAPMEEELSGAADKLSPKRQTVSEETKVTVASSPEAAKAEVLEPAKVENGYIDSVNRKRSVLLSHTDAVVNDAVYKARTCMNKGDFSGAREAIDVAEQTVSQNQMQLGDGAANEYNGQLKQISDTIAQKENDKNQQLQEQKRIETEQSQRTYRERMGVERKNRVTELMNNALAFQKQQRYEDALGQLDSLLAIDPLNNQALILKQTLEDMVTFRKQLEVQKQSSKETIATLLEADKSTIPYADELTYPKNWREIIANRKPDEAIGQDPASAVVYKELEKVVDLGQLTPEMSFGEAIDVLKNAVDPPLKVFVSWRDLSDNADIDRTTPINMDAISSVELGTALELLLKSVSGGFVKLGYTVENGVVKIATAEELGSKLETLVYDVSDLLGRPADFYAKSATDISSDIQTAGGKGFEEENIDRNMLRDEATKRAEALTMLIQETIAPSSWYDAGGEGTIKIYVNRKLIIHQTREVHKKIEGLLADLRKALGYQVAIEARFLIVGQNFLEDIGMTVNLAAKGATQNVPVYSYTYDSTGAIATKTPVIDSATGLQRTIPVTNNSLFSFQQNAAQQTLLPDTGVTGNWATVLQAPSNAQSGTPQIEVSPTGGAVTGVSGNVNAGLPGLTIAPGSAIGFSTQILNTLQADFLLRATQANRDAKSLTAPRVTVLNGESADIRVQRVTFYPANLQFNIEEIGTQGFALWTVQHEDRAYVTGNLMNITPTLTPDKKNVLLNVVTEMRDFLGYSNYQINGPQTSQGAASWTISYPDTELSRIETRVCVPDGGTLLMGGQKVTAEVTMESGVPILDKIPIIGRLFDSRSTEKDEKILLILVKPTIILQEEAEAKALAGT